MWRKAPALPSLDSSGLRTATNRPAAMARGPENRGLGSRQAWSLTPRPAPTHRFELDHIATRPSRRLPRDCRGGPLCPPARSVDRREAVTENVGAPHTEPEPLPREGESHAKPPYLTPKLLTPHHRPPGRTGPPPTRRTSTTRQPPTPLRQPHLGPRGLQLLHRPDPFSRPLVLHLPRRHDPRRGQRKCSRHRFRRWPALGIDRLPHRSRHRPARSPSCR